MLAPLPCHDRQIPIVNRGRAAAVVRRKGRLSEGRRMRTTVFSLFATALGSLVERPRLERAGRYFTFSRLDNKRDTHRPSADIRSSFPRACSSRSRVRAWRPDGHRLLSSTSFSFHVALKISSFWSLTSTTNTRACGYRYPATYQGCQLAS